MAYGFLVLDKTVVVREEVQNIASSGNHFTYYNPATQRVRYLRWLEQEKEEEAFLPDVFQRSCSTLSDLDIYGDEEEGCAYIAMAFYNAREETHSVDIARVSREGRLIPLASFSGHHAYIRKCSFLMFHGALSLVSWSIDGVQSVHRLGTRSSVLYHHPFKAYHVSASEGTLGVLDNDFILHVFHPDGGRRNLTLPNITQPVVACHLSVSAKAFFAGFPDGTVSIYTPEGERHETFDAPIRAVCGDATRYAVFLDTGEMCVYDTEHDRIVRVPGAFHPSSMRRVFFNDRFLVMDGDKEGFVIRRWKTPHRFSVKTHKNSLDGFLRDFMGNHMGNQTTPE